MKVETIEISELQPPIQTREAKRSIFDPEFEKKTIERLDHGELRPGIICISVENRRDIKKIVQDLRVQAFITILVIVDMVLTLSASNSDQGSFVNGSPHSIASFVILCTLLLEVVLRFIYMDVVPFFRDPLCIFDLIVVVGIFILELVFALELDFLGDVNEVNQMANIFLIFKVIRSLRVCASFYRHQKLLKKAAQTAVSGHRRRFQKDGFDIDVTHITDNLLAMSVPAVGTEGIYRNPIDEIVKFFETKFTNNYRFYNCCPEKKYPYEKFHNRVYEWFMWDHNPTPIHEIIDFCHHVYQWLNDKRHDKRVAAVHCKGGKGRTGTLICSYLIYAGIKGKNGTIRTAEDSTAHFAARRTDDVKETVGVEARSQMRYIQYMGVLMKELSDQKKDCSALIAPKGPVRKILKIRVIGISKIVHKFGIPIMEVSNGIWCRTRFSQYVGTVRDVQPNANLQNGEKYDYFDFKPDTPIEVQNDVKVSFYIEAKKDDLFGYWWHTYFEDGEEVKENEHIENYANVRVLKFTYMFVDGIRWAIKKKKFKHSFPKYFECQTFFQ